MSKKTKKISVVIPNYNHGHYLEKRIKSFISQTYPPYEIIIVDDCSTDKSCAILKKIQKKNKKVKVLQNKKNLGVEKSFNRGIIYASGDYIYPCSADDLNKNNFFLNTIKLFDLYHKSNICMTTPGFYYQKYKKMISKPREIPFNITKFYNSDEIINYQIKKNFTIWGHCCLYRASFLKKNLFDIKFKWHHDWFLLNKETLTNGMIYLPKTFCYFRKGLDSYSSKINHYEKNEVLKKMMLHIINREKKDVLKRFVKSMVFQVIIDNPFELIKNKKIRIFFTKQMIFRIFLNKFKKTMFSIFPQIVRLNLNQLYLKKNY